MKCRYIKTKKGAVSSVISDFWAYVAFVFVVMIFYAFFTYQAKGIEANKIKESATKINNDLHLLNFLRTPYTLGNRQIAMADLIAIYYNEKDPTKKKFYYDEIFKKSKELFDPFEKCIIPEGFSDKNVIGYAIFILDDKSYFDDKEFDNNYKAISRNADKKFRSEHFVDGLINEKSLGTIPDINPNQLLYVGFFVSSANIAGRQVSDVKGCA